MVRSLVRVAVTMLVMSDRDTPLQTRENLRILVKQSVRSCCIFLFFVIEIQLKRKCQFDHHGAADVDLIFVHGYGEDVESLSLPIVDAIA